MINNNHGLQIRELKYPAIDGIRFYAAFIVFLIHLSGALIFQVFHLAPDALSINSSSLLMKIIYVLTDGTHGVDMFFIISGFLIGRIVVNSKNFSSFNFIKKRFFRIYPAFLFSLIAMTIYLCNFQYMYGWFFSWKEFLGGIVFLNAIPEAHVRSYNFVTWSLGYEFAFYLMIPILKMLNNFFPKKISSLILLFFAFYFFYGSNYTRIIGLFVGSVISTFDDDELFKIAGFFPLKAVFIFYFFVTIFLKHIFQVSSLIFCDFFFVFGSLLFVKIAFNDNLISRIAKKKIFRSLGTVSYSFYLLHPLAVGIISFQLLPFLLLITTNKIFLSGLISIFSLALSLILANISYVLFEKPYFKNENILNSLEPKYCQS